jgi:hypothetical protein
MVPVPPVGLVMNEPEEKRVCWARAVGARRRGSVASSGRRGSVMP